MAVKRVLHNIATVFRHPEYGISFLCYLASRIRKRGHATVAIGNGARLSHLTGFSEYRAASEYIGPRELAFLHSFAFPDGCIIDVGANIGGFSVLLSRRYPDRTLYAFEPNPSAQDALAGNIKLNNCNNVNVQHEAVTTQTGPVPFLVDDQYRAMCRIPVDEDGDTIEADGISLDDFCRQRSITSIGLLKLDVEGFEADALIGAEAMLRDYPPDVVYYEIAPDMCEGREYDALAATRILIDAGYLIHDIAEDGSLVPITSPSLAGIVVTNWVAIRPESRTD